MQKVKLRFKLRHWRQSFFRINASDLCAVQFASVQRKTSVSGLNRAMEKSTLVHFVSWVSRQRSLIVNTCCVVEHATHALTHTHIQHTYQHKNTRPNGAQERSVSSVSFTYRVASRSRSSNTAHYESCFTRSDSERAIEYSTGEDGRSLHCAFRSPSWIAGAHVQMWAR